MLGRRVDDTSTLKSSLGFLGYVHLLFHLPYRQTEGFLKALRRFDSRIHVPDYSTIDRRVNRLDVKLDEEDYGDDLVLAVDGSGIKVSNRGDWIRHKWKVRRGFLKIHIAVDVKRRRILTSSHDCVGPVR
jgi:hypothetical protein